MVIFKLKFNLNKTTTQVVGLASLNLRFKDLLRCGTGKDVRHADRLVTEVL